MAGADQDLQFHLATNASDTAAGGCLFQVYGVLTGTTLTPKHRANEKIIMLMSFRFNDAETRYHTTEREALAVVRCLAEVRWLVIGNKFPVMIYSDHNALSSILNKGDEGHGRISRWKTDWANIEMEDRLGEYDFEVNHMSARDPHMGIADGLSRMPTRLTSKHKAEDSERLPFAMSAGNVDQVLDNNVWATPAGWREDAERWISEKPRPEPEQSPVKVMVGTGTEPDESPPAIHTEVPGLAEGTRAEHQVPEPGGPRRNHQREEHTIHPSRMIPDRKSISHPLGTIVSLHC
jgi:hypothetical protein